MKNNPDPYLSVLVVEDDIYIQMLMTKLLEQYDLPVYIADNGVHAINILKNIKTEKLVIVLDLSMPVMNGFEFLKTWENDQERFHSNNTFIYIHSSTPDTDTLTLKKTNEKSITGCIAKPATNEMIHTIIQPLLHQKYDN